VRVLMQSRSDMRPGGEATQIRETAGRLRARGVQVDVSGELEPDLRGVDLVHVFGLTQPAEPLLQAEHAARHGVPIALSPAYQDLSEYNRRGRHGLAAAAYRILPSGSAVEVVKQAMRARHAAGRRGPLLRLLRVPFEAQQQRLIERVAVVLPNSPLEAAAIAYRFSPRVPCRVVPNGAAAGTFLGARPAAFVDATGLRDFVVAVGFISSLKNQLRLIAALDGTGLRLVTAGGSTPTHAGYYRAVRRAAARHGVVMLGHLPHDRLASVLAAARVIALPSWFETCGIAGLEGVLAGCRPVITDRGYARDYFGDDASYCDPGDVPSIRRAVLAAMDAPAPLALRERILTAFTWDAAADATLDAYRAVLGGNGRR
jgi:glycosyltransferase involved in cell wall biosynthesis